MHTYSVENIGWGNQDADLCRELLKQSCSYLALLRSFGISQLTNLACSKLTFANRWIPSFAAVRIAHRLQELSFHQVPHHYFALTQDESIQNRPTLGTMENRQNRPFQ